ncbi:MAG TPA: DUF4097 family beta strand repeat-containing protein [Vicinamibacterales bacterium]|nr:DUF4097 family beta strand repeat-containing protein [Vicinamibacterales bacterium]
MKHNLAIGWAIAALSLPAVSFAQTFTFERTVPVTAAVTRIDVTTDNGSVRVSAGEDDHIVVNGTVKLRRGGFVLPVEAPELAKAVADKPPISGEGNTVFLRQPADRMTRDATYVSYDVRVPARLMTQVTTTSGGISIAAVAGAVTIKTSSGAIELAGVKGDIAISSSSSGIKATDLGGALRVDNTSGRIEATFNGAGGASLKTDSGEIWLTGLRGETAITTQSSKVTLQGSPAAPWRVTTGSGVITMKADAAASFNLDATSETSDVKSSGLGVTGTVKGRLEAPVGKGGPVVTLRSHSGQVRVER